MQDHIRRTNVLGVGISAINIPMALEILDAWIRQRHHTYVCVTGVHGVMESQADPELRKIHNQAGLVTPDGMPMVWLSRLAGHKHVDRVYGPDLMLAVCQASLQKGYRHFFYGGNEGVPELLRDKLQEKFPGLQVVGTYSPPFRPLTPEEDAAIVARINAARPDIVWVGLSTPKQERWMAAHLGKVQAPVMVGVGAAFDFHAGLKPQAPRWMQQSGMEWFFRMVTEPKRLARRYLHNNPRFVVAVLMQLLGLRRYHLDI
ncbi:WecB/TagA/CpsF family glycosyltransferase [Meiothermus sp.]|uniref:WecB/TagA/CpsF family glycosyltransferase n=1 Tax=Meiothermus sp. TaxID=1955249 RepID=UPI0021DC9BB3|nr:WecB/TagA/CpsF family glycosyltransferase [Meiothermus sp.]GIW26208.1 MAG: glycosyl transferase [Meiothermus sp.]